MSTRQISDALEVTRRMSTRDPGHPVVSLYLDLNPEQFATAQARASQIRSLVDEAARDVDEFDGLTHDERAALRQDVERLDAYLNSEELPVSGAGAIGVFADGQDDLHTVVLAHSVGPRVVIDRTPFLEPLVATAAPGQWCVALVSRRDGRVFTGPGTQLDERETVDADVHGQHQQGGWSQARYERSYEEEADRHLRDVADALHRRFRDEGFDRLVLGGPPEIVPRFAEMLHEDIKPVLHDTPIQVDVATAGVDDVRAAVAPLAELAENELERRVLNRFAQGMATEGRAAGGLGPTLQALTERRVETLLLAPDFDTPGFRCPSCGLLSAEDAERCPADGTPMIAIRHLGDAAIEAALAQDADVQIVSRHPDLGPHGGVGAVLRF